MARVVVIGGGYGGVTVAKGLDPIAEVILVEQKDRFVHHAAALRAAVDSVWSSTIFMPYDYLLKRGKVVKGTVSRVEGTTVHIFGQDPIEADYVVFATGSTYPFPAKHVVSNHTLAYARIEQLHQSLRQASTALLIGAGTVGLELAGELAYAFPDLSIVIVEQKDRLMPNEEYTEEFRAEIERQVEQLGIRVVTGSRLAYYPTLSAAELGHFQVETESGEQIQADIWFQCYGSQANSGYLVGTEYAHILRKNGTVRVEPTMQVVGHRNSYAVGDISDVPESKRADAARHQARVVIANIASQIENGEADAVYQPTKEWVVLPLGPNLGAAQLLDAQGRTRVVGAEPTSEIKGIDLMVSVIRSQLNLP